MPTIKLTVNAKPVTTEVEARTLLVDLIREHLKLTGTHVGCDTSQCGACVVMVGGQSVKSCSMLAVEADGQDVTTIEGMAKDGELHPMQKAFHENHGLQCGFCTPGFVMAITACLEKDASASLEDVKRSCAGNTCRCGTYPHIFDAAMTAGRNLRGGKR